MARIEAKLKLGYYPLATEEAARIGRFLRFGGPASVLDPCCGTGAALRQIAGSEHAACFGIELDAHRAADARLALHEAVHGSLFETHCPIESFSLLHLNPPYDFEIGEGKNQRLERAFLDHTYRWLKPGGVLILIVPQERVWDCRTVLSTHFKEKAIYRLTAPEAAGYRQVAVFGVRRTRQERDRLTDASVQQANHKLQELTRQHDAIPALPDSPDRCFVVPPGPPARLEYRGLPLDQVEDLLANSLAWLQARRITHPPQAAHAGRPLTPLHKGHVAICCTSSLLNGRFGSGPGLHLAFWESVKVLDKMEEQGEQGELVVRERERFAQRLTLLYASGRFALLSDRGNNKESGNAQRTPADGKTDLHPAEG